MGKIFGKRAAWLGLYGILVFSSVGVADDRTADKILAEIKAIEMPAIPKDRNDRAAIQAYITAANKASSTKSELIGELLKVAPESPELAALLPTRWQVLAMNPETTGTVKAETNAIIAKGKEGKLLPEAYFFKSMATIQTPDATPEELKAAYEPFAEKFPKDPRVPIVLVNAARGIKDAAEQEKIFKRIEADYPTSQVAKQVPMLRQMAEGERKKLAKIGKPFELEFTEATKGTQITMASLKGKVVVIDFWATWCGPCIAEMPNMKKLYAEYKDKGVEFIGVSLDQPKEKGGLDKLKDYVAKNDIQWPQYYQGNYWQSEFSAGWGVNSIPCVFLVDADGNLASIDARGKLEKMIPEYLEKAKAKKTASNP